MLHTLAEIGRVKATCDHCSQVGAFDTVISFGTYPPRLSVAICGKLYLHCHVLMIKLLLLLLLLLYVLHFRVEPDPSKAVNLNVTFDSNAPCVVGELLPSK